MTAVYVALIVGIPIAALYIYCLWRGPDEDDPRYVTIFRRKNQVKKS